MKIAVPALPCVNFLSVLKVIEKSGGSGELVQQPADLRRYDRIILPGVGAFDHGMESLNINGWTDTLNELVLHRKVPVLGICLGMQLMCIDSEEGHIPGLGWIHGHVRRFCLPTDSSLKIPHMGWNTITVQKQNPLIPFDESEQRFYFVHSFHAVCNRPEDVLATTSHGYEVTAAFCKDNIFGVQFHPEKSHRFGLALVKRFVEMPC